MVRIRSNLGPHVRRPPFSSRHLQLFSQFVFESVLLALVALALAALLDLLFIPLLNNLIGRKLSAISIFSHPLELVSVVAITLFLGLLTGVYPSFYMTSFNLARVMKGGSKVEGKSLFRSGLVVVQFGLALAMIVSTLIVLQQLYFMKNRDIGFKKDQMMLIGMNKEANQKFETVKQELLRNKLVQVVTASGQRLGNNFHQWGFKVKGDTGVFEITPSNVNVDYDYLTVYGIQVKEGRNFSKDFATDNGRAFIINESFAKELALKETVGTPAGHSWYKNDSLGSIIGVVKDFNFEDLHMPVAPYGFFLDSNIHYNYAIVHTRQGNLNPLLKLLEASLNKLDPGEPFDYSFMDEDFQRNYLSDKRLSSLVNYFTAIAIIISCMGLFGLVTFSTEQRRKEISVRKVLGASVNGLVALLVKDLLKLVIIAVVFASPVAWFAMDKWLQGFISRVHISWSVFIFSAAIVVVIACLTISFQALRAALASPVKNLKNE